MAEADEKVQAALDALSDDRAFDWDAAAGADPAARRTLDKLRLIAAVAHACRDDAMPARPLPDLPFRWGPLMVESRLGRGGSGEVFRARDPRLDRHVALKLLPLGTGDADPAAAGLVREARLLARVQHPHVVSVHGAEHADGYVGIWMELVEGRTLDRVVREDGALPPLDVLAIAADLCSALAAVHDAGLVHGDIKAQNIVRSTHGRIVLMDFGAGRDARVAGDAQVTGTPLYMAPEVLAGAPISVQSDIYALGVLLSHLLTGRYPVMAGTLEELADAHLRRHRADHGPQTPTALAQVIDRALDPEPSRRFADVRAMAAALVGARPVRQPSRLVTATATAIVAALVLASLGWLAAARRNASSVSGSAPTLRHVPLPNVMLMGRPAPDGTWITATDLQGNLARLSLLDGRLQPLTTDAATEGEQPRVAGFSSVAPDGRSIVYGWMGPGQPFELRLLDFGAAASRVLWRAADVRGAYPLDWWPDRQSLLITQQHLDGSASVARLFLRDGRMVRLADLPGPVPEHASLSPDGEWVAYDAPERGAEGPRDIHVVRADGGADTIVAAHSANDFAPIWSTDGSRLLFLSDRSGGLDLWSLRLDGTTTRGIPDVMMRDVGRVRVLGLTAGGSLLHQRLGGAADIYLSDLDTPAPTAIADTFVGLNLSPRWSPDASQIAYASRRGAQGPDGGTTVLVVREVGSGSRREWSPPLRGFTVADWSDDGARVLLYGFDQSGALGSHAFDLRSGSTRPVAAAGGASGAAQFTRSGGVLYVDAARRAAVLDAGDGGAQTTLLDFAAAGIEGIVGGIQARGLVLSPDEQALAYSASVVDGARRAMVVRVLDRRTGRTRELARAAAPESVVLHDWTADGEEVIVTRRTPAAPRHPSVWRIRADTGTSTEVALPLEAVRDISAAPTGQRITFAAGIATLDVWALDLVGQP